MAQQTAVEPSEMKQVVLEKVLQERIDSEVQVMQQVALDEARKSGLYDVLKSEIDGFLDFFLDSNSWKRLYVASKFGSLNDEFEDCTGDERRIKTMEFASQMSELVGDTFENSTREYQRAMAGLGRIIQLLLNWDANRISHNFPKFRGTKLDGDPIQFLQRNYAQWIVNGRLSQISLRASD